MGLFGTTTKKRDIGGNGNARVQVMGTGCRKCHALYEAATEALGADQVDYVTDMGNGRERRQSARRIHLHA